MNGRQVCVISNQDTVSRYMSHVTWSGDEAGLVNRYTYLNLFINP